MTQRFIEDVKVGAEVPERTFGPHDLVTAVFWAGVQENRGLLHLDRDHARALRGAKSFVASGALRQSFLAQTLTDWGGPRSFLRAMTLRHSASTYEGDMQRYTAKIVEKSADADDPAIVLDFDGRNQDGEQIMRGRATLLLPGQDWAPARSVWDGPGSAARPKTSTAEPNADDEGLITDEMRACLGTTTPAVELPEEISASDVRRFVETVGEHNLLYRDPSFAARFGHRERVVPAMLIVQLFRRLDDAESETKASTDWPGLTLPANYTNARNAGHDFTWVRPVYVGDRLTVQAQMVDMYVRRGRKGVPVIYLVRQIEIRNQLGEPVVRQISTTARLPEMAVTEA